MNITYKNSFDKEIEETLESIIWNNVDHYADLEDKNLSRIETLSKINSILLKLLYKNKIIDEEFIKEIVSSTIYCTKETIKIND
jgi:predicted ATP-dependent Lon-type protease